VAALFLGVLAGVDAADRAHDFAVLRALGWRDRRIVTVCMTEVLARGGLALLLALPLAPVLGRLLLGRLALADFPQMTLELPVWVFALVGGAVLAALPLGGLPALRAATRVTPARALRRLTGE
ncbi:MAG: FtsX-like permease family protein, partial [Planctomycetota bacterium]|nr:FtsX-like permease family protein [Planctomycetota bacterium]